MLKLTAALAMAGAAVATIHAQAQAQAAPRTFTVVMDNMNFGSVPKDAKVGDTIVWDNRDTVEHTATARDGSFDVRLQPGKKARTVLRKAGSLAIYCIYHPMMRTTLRVAGG
ncbi:MAG TPA: cupredoxin domain-containing protein [Croceibacterium sp.]|nr:cupredoxin domain-containing protein [Croceibacterium sp.]